MRFLIRGRRKLQQWRVLRSPLRTRDLEHAAELKGLIAELNGDQRPREQPAADEMTAGLSALLTSVERAA